MARSSSKPKALTRVSIEVLPGAEDMIGVCFEKVFNVAPSLYTDEETRRTTASVYLERWQPALRQQFGRELAELQSFVGQEIHGRITVTKLPPENWAESWKRHFHALDVGPLLIKPSWIKRKPRKDQSVIVLDPGLSFGTGQHATTYFCLEQIVRCRNVNKSQSFMDMGTGSGILAIAAAKLGYKPIVAFDFDAEAVRISRENAEANGVSSVLRPVRQDLTKVPLKTNRQFDVLCANLIYDLLLQEAPRILNRLKPGGHLVLAGILQKQFPQVKKHYASLGMKLVETKVEREWQSGRFIGRE